MTSERRPICRRIAPLAMSLALLAATATARAAAGTDSEQLRINSERSAANANFSSRVAECERRFVITSCVEDAKRDRREALDALKARQLQLDETRRRARTAERRDELAAKAAEDARREHERAAHSAMSASSASASASAGRDSLGRSLEPRRPAAANAVVRTASQPRQDRPGHGLGVEPAKSEAPELRRASEERHRASFEDRQREAAAHRAEVLDKAAKREQGRPPAAPLLVPSAASAASASSR